MELIRSRQFCSSLCGFTPDCPSTCLSELTTMLGHFLKPAHIYFGDCPRAGGARSENTDWTDVIS